MSSARCVSATATSAARLRSSRASSWAIWRMPSAVVSASRRIVSASRIACRRSSSASARRLRDDRVGLDARLLATGSRPRPGRARARAPRRARPSRRACPACPRAVRRARRRALCARRGGVAQLVALGDVVVDDRLRGARSARWRRRARRGRRRVPSARSATAASRVDDPGAGFVEVGPGGLVRGDLLRERGLEAGDLGVGVLELGERVVAVLGPFGDLRRDGGLEPGGLGLAPARAGRARLSRSAVRVASTRLEAGDLARGPVRAARSRRRARCRCVVERAPRAARPGRGPRRARPGSRPARSRARRRAPPCARSRSSACSRRSLGLVALDGRGRRAPGGRRRARRCGGRAWCGPRRARRCDRRARRGPRRGAAMPRSRAVMAAARSWRAASRSPSVRCRARRTRRRAGGRSRRARDRATSRWSTAAFAVVERRPGAARRASSRSASAALVRAAAPRRARLRVRVASARAARGRAGSRRAPRCSAPIWASCSAGRAFELDGDGPAPRATSARSSSRSAADSPSRRFELGDPRVHLFELAQDALAVVAEPFPFRFLVRESALSSSSTRPGAASSSARGRVALGAASLDDALELLDPGCGVARDRARGLAARRRARSSVDWSSSSSRGGGESCSRSCERRSRRESARARLDVALRRSRSGARVRESLSAASRTAVARGRDAAARPSRSASVDSSAATRCRRVGQLLFVRARAPSRAARASPRARRPARAARWRGLPARLRSIERSRRSSSRARRCAPAAGRVPHRARRLGCAPRRARSSSRARVSAFATGLERAISSSVIATCAVTVAWLPTRRRSRRVELGVAGRRSRCSRTVVELGVRVRRSVPSASSRSEVRCAISASAVRAASCASSRSLRRLGQLLAGFVGVAFGAPRGASVAAASSARTCSSSACQRSARACASSSTCVVGRCGRDGFGATGFGSGLGAAAAGFGRGRVVDRGGFGGRRREARAALARAGRPARNGSERGGRTAVGPPRAEPRVRARRRRRRVEVARRRGSACRTARRDRRSATGATSAAGAAATVELGDDFGCGRSPDAARRRRRDFRRRCVRRLDDVEELLRGLQRDRRPVRCRARSSRTRMRPIVSPAVSGSSSVGSRAARRRRVGRRARSVGRCGVGAVRPPCTARTRRSSRSRASCNAAASSTSVSWYTRRAAARADATVRLAFSVSMTRCVQFPDRLHCFGRRRRRLRHAARGSGAAVIAGGRVRCRSTPCRNVCVVVPITCRRAPRTGRERGCAARSGGADDTSSTWSSSVVSGPA